MLLDFREKAQAEKAAAWLNENLRQESKKPPLYWYVVEVGGLYRLEKEEGEKHGRKKYHDHSKRDRGAAAVFRK